MFNKFRLIVRVLAVLGISGLLWSCGGGGSPAPAPAPAPTVLNGSFETGDYSSWTLSDDSNPHDATTGTFAVLPTGTPLPRRVMLLDHQDNVTNTDICIVNAGANFPVSVVSDGLVAGLLTQQRAARHSLIQDIAVKATDSNLLWDMAYQSAAAINATTHFIALNIIDPATQNILDTPYKLATTDPQVLVGFTTFSVDLTPYRGQTIRIELELMIRNGCFTVFFDNFRAQ